VTKQPFKALPIGATFRFASELALGWQGARGPWIKLSPRKYAPEDMSAAHKVGSINADAVPVFGKTKLPAPLPLTGSPCTCRKGIERDNCSRCEGTGKAIDWAAHHRAKN
jgi:hypothetical protein